MARKGIAGNHGGRIRSDCRVSVELTDSGGIDLELQSKVEPLYGESIRELCLKMMAFFEAGNAKILIEDSGALEFVLAARIESALKKVHETDKQYLLDHRLDKSISVRDRFRFTRLYLPGNSPSMMLNAGIHGPEGIILDLEDSVAHGVKDDARILVRNALRNVNFYGAEKMVRINQLPMGLKDLEAVIPQDPDLILLPKAENAEQLKQVDQKIREISGEREVFIMPILESALGIENAFEIAKSVTSVAAMAIGLEDYTADMGVQRTEEGTESIWARSRMVNACKAAGIQAIDSVYSDVANEEGLRSTVQRSKAMGFEGMGCIHPRQVPVVQEAFKPAAPEVDKAKKIVLAFEKAEREGLGVVSLGSKMIDPPVVKRAQRTIDLAIKMNLLNENWRDDHEQE